MIFPPKAAPIAWCPKQTPRIGTSEDLMSSTDIPASFGVHGPGDITILLGLLSIISVTDISSFLMTLMSCSNSPI